MYEQEDFHRPEIPLEKTREIDNEATKTKPLCIISNSSLLYTTE